MKIIHKHNVGATWRTTLQLPAGAEFLSVHKQKDQISAWFLVDPTAPLEPRRFRIVGTGAEIDEPEGLKFLGTILSFDHSMVWHLFECQR